MKLSALGQIALPITNADVSKTFYDEKLGLPFLFRYGDLIFFDCGGVRLMLEGNPKQSIQIPRSLPLFQGRWDRGCAYHVANARCDV